MTQDFKSLTPEILMSYADGALPPEDAAVVKAASDADPDIARQVAEFKASRRALETAFSDVLAEPVPSHLEDLVRGTPASSVAGEDVAEASRGTVVNLADVRARKAKPSGFSTIQWRPAIAASFAILAVGGLFASDLFRSNDTIVQVALGPQKPGTYVAQALDDVPSGQSQDIGDGAVVTMVASYQTTTGICREFDISVQGSTDAALACRTSGIWNVVATEASAGSSGGQIVPAGAGAGQTIDDALSARNAQDALSSEDESLLIKAGW